MINVSSTGGVRTVEHFEIVDARSHPLTLLSLLPRSAIVAGDPLTDSTSSREFAVQISQTPRGAKDTALKKRSQVNLAKIHSSVSSARKLILNTCHPERSE
jgi:hypothetical protein